MVDSWMAADITDMQLGNEQQSGGYMIGNNAG
jgi:hypothetical protein